MLQLRIGAWVCALIGAATLAARPSSAASGELVEAAWFTELSAAWGADWQVGEWS